MAGDAEKNELPSKEFPWSIQIFIAENWDSLCKAEKTTQVL